MVILVNKKRAVLTATIIVVVICFALLYKPYLKKFEYPLYMEEYVTRASQEYGIDPYLVYSVMKAESKFDESALSNKGAQGLMQITPETAEWAMEKMGIKGEIFEPEINISVGSWYLAKLIKDHEGNLTAALAAYNAGSTNVNEWKDEAGNLSLSDIQFQETYDYVYKTIEYYENYKKLYLKGE